MSEVEFPVSTGSAVQFEGTAACPQCKVWMRVLWVVQENWPYSHGDFCLACPRCGWKAVFGIPVNKLFGMELIIWDTEPRAVLKQAEKQTAPVCPFHNKRMSLTKIWGDKAMKDPTQIRVQWKCPEWYLTIHRTLKRAKPSKHGAKAKKEIQERLKQLGYVD